MNRIQFATALGVAISLLIPAVNAVTAHGGFMPFGPGMRNSVMSGIQDSADFAIKIHPPVENLDDTLKSLDGIMMMEDAERRAANEDFVDAEQRLLAVHKGKIREIVAAAMEPIHALFTQLRIDLDAVMQNHDTL
ncbi:hypothetical protein X943_003017 [Babesia divergens]|uniref:Uncharacterized protein n=1 Tax=Babesia divergens TaxID=32595 RepID=A0AAD9G7K1_BABDI|nr:hypothetical protein X943_003017 [Babesia divergens]